MILFFRPMDASSWDQISVGILRGFRQPVKIISIKIVAKRDRCGYGKLNPLAIINRVRIEMEIPRGPKIAQIGINPIFQKEADRD